MIRALFVDVGSVLIHFDLKDSIGLYEKHNSIPAGKLYEAFHDHQYWKDFTLGLISQEDFLNKVSENFNGELDIQEFIQFFYRNYTANTELFEYLRSISGKYILGIISNNPKELFDYFYDTYGWSEIFKVRAVSSYIHIRKPDKRIFEYAIQQTGVKPEESIYFDDRIDRIDGARDLGMHLHIFEDNNKLKDFISNLGK